MRSGAPARRDTKFDRRNDRSIRLAKPVSRLACENRDERQQLAAGLQAMFGEDVRTRDGLETPVRDGSTVILLPAMAGGAPSRAL